jgi:hypothetical protein
MTEVGLTPPEEARVQQAADEAYRVLTGDEGAPAQVTDRWLETVRRATLRAPLQSLAVAFLLGIWVARRR